MREKVLLSIMVVGIAIIVGGIIAKSAGAALLGLAVYSLAFAAACGN